MDCKQNEHGRVKLQFHDPITSSSEVNMLGLLEMNFAVVMLDSASGNFTITSFGSEGVDLDWHCIRYLSIKLSSYRYRWPDFPSKMKESCLFLLCSVEVDMISMSIQHSDK